MDLLTVTLDNAQRLLLLAIPALLGLVVGRVALFEDNERAVRVLNVFALYVGFPALVFRGVVDDSFALPTDLGFWIAVPLAHLLAVGFLGFWRPRPVRGTLALVALFGNVAYLGLPLVVGIFGESVAGRAALLVAIHVAISVSVGPYLLRRWSGGDASTDLKKLAMQPLLWAPVAGLAARYLPETARGGLELAVTPLAASAAPVALFLLGLYVWIKRDLVVGKVPSSWLHIGARMVVVPAATTAVCLALRALGLLDDADASLLIVLSGMPAAITTFSIAHDARIGDEVVAATIVRTTVLSIVTLPLLAAAAQLI